MKLAGHAGGVRWADFSPDGRFLATASTGDQRVRIRDPKSGETLFFLPDHHSGVSNLDFSPAGALVATSSGNVAYLWRTDNGQLISKLAGHAEVINELAFSPDGKLLVTGSDDKTACCWDTSTGTCVATLTGHTEAVRSVLVSPDGRAVLTTSSSPDLPLLWDLPSGRLIGPVDGGPAAFSPDGRLLALYTAKNSVEIWSAITASRVATLTGHTSTINKAIFSPDGATIAADSWDGTVKLWDVPRG
ncbi:WD40 repeat domain-containing protein [Micromonospora sp. NPDC048999]|uniref:WD40 repeat domain-containing protein n=1 Tax=Micromonospora sp. NPDC048999 TaxID=3155391 RepID=UPI0034047C16